MQDNAKESNKTDPTPTGGITANTVIAESSSSQTPSKSTKTSSRRRSSHHRHHHHHRRHRSSGTRRSSSSSRIIGLLEPCSENSIARDDEEDVLVGDLPKQQKQKKREGKRSHSSGTRRSSSSRIIGLLEPSKSSATKYEEEEVSVVGDIVEQDGQEEALEGDDDEEVAVIVGDDEAEQEENNEEGKDSRSGTPSRERNAGYHTNDDDEDEEEVPLFVCDIADDEREEEEVEGNRSTRSRGRKAGSRTKDEDDEEVPIVGDMAEEEEEVVVEVKRSRSGTPSKSPGARTRKAGSLTRNPTSRRRSSPRSGPTRRHSSSGPRRHSSSRNLDSSRHSPPRSSSRRRSLLEESKETSGNGTGRSKRRVMSERNLASSNSRRNLTSSSGKSRRKLQRPQSTSDILLSSKPTVRFDSMVDQLPPLPFYVGRHQEDVSTITGEIQQAKEEEGEEVEENDKGEHRKLKIFLILVLLVLIGVGIVVLIRRRRTNTATITEGKNTGDGSAGNNNNSTGPGPSVLVGDKIPPSPTVLDDRVSVNPSTAPSFHQIYDPPNKDDCDRIRKGLPIDRQDDMDTKLFELAFDVTISSQAISKQAWVPAFQEGIDTVLIPALLGCPPIGMNWRQRRRIMGKFQEIDQQEHRQQRELQSIGSEIRYLIGNANATIDVDQDVSSTCDIPKDGCSRVAVPLQLYLKGEERGYAILSLIIQVISYLEEMENDSNRQLAHVSSSSNNKNDDYDRPSRKLLEQILDLNLFVFEDVTFRGVNDIDPTMAPSASPTRMPSAMPSSLPSKDPSAVPSSMPSRSPTPPPTPGPTPPPTPGPTRPPTPRPTSPPTRKPSPGPTSRPTSQPTSGPTKPPTPKPTGNPTSGPTFGPTTCEDDTSFVDSGGYNCQWYTDNELPGCPTFGQEFGTCTSGSCSATEACCHCQLPAPPPTPSPTSGPTIEPTGSPTSGPTETRCIDDEFLDLDLDNCAWYEDNEPFGCLNVGDTVGSCLSSPTGFCTATEACCHCSEDNPPLDPCADNPTFRDDLNLDDCSVFAQIDPDCSKNGTDPGTCSVLSQPFTCSAMDACCHCSEDPFCTDDPFFQDDNGDCQWYADNDSVGCTNFGNLYNGTCFPTILCTPEQACCHCQ